MLYDRAAWCMGTLKYLGKLSCTALDNISQVPYFAGMFRKNIIVTRTNQ